MSNRFIELNWLARSDKDILLPEVVFVDDMDMDCSGFCMYPRKEEILIDGRYYSRSRGVIVIKSDDPCIDSTLAHEWRHLWQVYHYGEREDGYAMWGSESHLSYKQQIVNYFKSDVIEMDALLFERKKASCEIIDEWYEWIIKEAIKR